MAARSVDQINITNWQSTGSDIQVDQYSVDIEVRWTDDDGEPHHHGPEAYLWPNVLADVPLSSIRYFMEQMVIAKVRVTLGIDIWENYS